MIIQTKSHGFFTTNQKFEHFTVFRFVLRAINGACSFCLFLV